MRAYLAGLLVASFYCVCVCVCVQESFAWIWPTKTQDTVSMRIKARRSVSPEPVSQAIRCSLRASSAAYRAQMDGTLDLAHATHGWRAMTKPEILYHAWASGQVSCNQYVGTLKPSVNKMTSTGDAILRGLLAHSRSSPAHASSMRARHPSAHASGAPARRHSAHASSAPARRPSDHASSSPARRLSAHASSLPARRHSAAAASGHHHACVRSSSTPAWCAGWRCPLCTHVNPPDAAIWICAMCGTMRETDEDALSLGSRHSDVSHLSFCATEYSLEGDCGSSASGTAGKQVHGLSNGARFSYGSDKG